MTQGRTKALLVDVRYQNETYHRVMEQVREAVMALGEDATKGLKYGGLMASVQTDFVHAAYERTLKN